MPRRARLVLPNIPLHLIQRGNNRQACFYCDDDYRTYLEKASLCANEAGCQIHAYVLMTNHVHLLLSAIDADGPSALMKALGQRYVQYVNRTYRRTGTLWEGRYRSCPVQDDTYLLTCQRYIEMNPVRAGMVEHPVDYCWSSYRANALGENDPLTKPHSLYDSMGSDPESRQAAYRDLFKSELSPNQINNVRNATNGNFALGNDRFANEVSQALGQRVVPSRAGRPRKQAVSDSTDPPST